MKVFNSVIIFIYFNLKRIIDYNQFWILSIIDFAEWSIMPITNLSSNNFKMFHFVLFDFNNNTNIYFEWTISKH